MAEIDRIPPSYRIPPAKPATGPGQGSQAPQRKQNGERRDDSEKRRRDKGGGRHRIDEYA